MKRVLGCALGLLVAVAGARADMTRPASARFADAAVEEIPSFRQHVLPLLGRLGCNGRACHGSFQGQGGFRLSLFGYDFQADHDALVAGDDPRVNLQQPRESLILQKPTLVIDHDGGERMKPDSWQYNLLRRWIESGAPPYQESEPQLEALEVEPREIVFQKPGETAQLRIVARWSDGKQEDVTCLCRFQTNDEAVATIDELGRVAAVGKGDTHVVAFYDNGVVPVPAMLPVSDLRGPRYPDVPTPTRIDELVVAKLRKLGIVPSELCSDEEFLRRASLDMTGTLPTAEEIRAFLADSSPDKRARKIDELLERPTYAAWWTTKLGDFTGNSEQNVGEQQLRREMSEQWYRWLHRRVAENVPYDQIIEGIVLATSREDGQPYEDYAAEMSTYFRAEDPADFAERETLPHFWTRRTFRQPKEMALGFAYSFLGVRLQCAECHKHPFDQWTQQDFEQFTAFFRNVRYGQSPAARDFAREFEDKHDIPRGGQGRRVLAELVRKGEVVPWNEVFIAGGRDGDARRRNRPGAARAAGRVITPKLLGGEEVVAKEYPDPRAALMEWMRDRGNPYFARAFVNRVWATYFNAGIIDPPDDMSLANPPSNAPLLDYLTEGFIEHGYDMKWLHREIARSHTYQRSWQTNETNEHDVRNFSRAVVRRLPAEVAYDAIVLATAGEQALEKLHQQPTEGRAIGVSSGLTGYNGRGGNYAMKLFGKPDRTTNCDCERSNEASLLQSVFLRNDQEVLGLLDRNDGWLREIARERAGGGRGAADGELQEQIERLEQRLQRLRSQDNNPNRGAAIRQVRARLSELRNRSGQAEVAEEGSSRPAGNREPGPRQDELIRDAYLRTLGRFPNDLEMNTARDYLAESENTHSGLRDLLWALLNTKEFIVNR